MLNVARGFHLFVLTILIGQTKTESMPNNWQMLQKAEILCGTIGRCYKTCCAYFLHRKHCVLQSKSFQNLWACFRKAINSSEEFFLFWKFSVPEKSCKSLSGTLSQLWETRPHSKGCEVYWMSFASLLGGWDFSSLQMYTRTRGRPFWGGYVCSRGCLSNLMLLIEDAIFSTKYHLQSLQDFISKSLY